MLARPSASSSRLARDRAQARLRARGQDRDRPQEVKLEDPHPTVLVPRLGQMQGERRGQGPQVLLEPAVWEALERLLAGESAGTLEAVGLTSLLSSLRMQ